MAAAVCFHPEAGHGSSLFGAYLHWTRKPYDSALDPPGGGSLDLEIIRNRCRYDLTSSFQSPQQHSQAENLRFLQAEQ